jgi:hypothetical protein
MSTKKIIPFNILLSFYGIIPLVWLVLVIDIFYLNGKIKSILPSNPDDQRLFLLFFLWPHIIMSLVTMLDKEYMGGYIKSINIYKSLGFISIFFIYFINKEFFFLIYAILTLKHFTCQQIGMEILSSGPQPKSSFVTYFLILLVLNCWVEFPRLPLLGDLRFFLVTYKLDFYFFGVVSVFLFYKTFCQYLKNNKNPIILGNSLLLVTIYLTFLLGYPFFSFLIPRIIHDLTAMIFYLFHDYNRNINEKKNSIFKIIPYTQKYFFIWPFLFSILFANFLFELAIRFEVMAIFLFSLGLLHYFVEDFIWKKDGLHRREIFVNVDFR